MTEECARMDENNKQYVVKGYLEGDQKWQGYLKPFAVMDMFGHSTVSLLRMS